MTDLHKRELLLQNDADNKNKYYKIIWTIRYNKVSELRCNSNLSFGQLLLLHYVMSCV